MIVFLDVQSELNSRRDGLCSVDQSIKMSLKCVHSTLTSLLENRFFVCVCVSFQHALLFLHSVMNG